MSLNTNLNFDLKTLIALFILIASVQGCKENPAPEESATMPSQREVNRSMEEIVRKMSQEEDAVIEKYIAEQGWGVTKTGTGLRYFVYEEGLEGPLTVDGQIATLKYIVSLIDGTVVYSSEEDGVRAFMVGHDNVESGIHEAILFLKVGDKAKLVLPSHLAHGLTGDNDKIPPRSTVIYDVELLGLR